MAKKHFTMLAHKFDPIKHGPGGWFASEKLDGQRCIWIPGTRGLLKSEVPFANLEKDERYVEQQYCSGLWSRYGNVIHAPSEWLDQLPDIVLDGELFLRRGRGGRQELSKIIRPIQSDAEAWEQVTFYCFDIPAVDILLGDRNINITNYNKNLKGVADWWRSLGVTLEVEADPDTQFRSVVFMLKKYLTGKVARPLDQFQLAMQTSTAIEQLEAKVDAVSEADGEGVMVRCPASLWVPERSHKLLKIKRLSDAEGKVTGYVTGRKTDKGSKLLGLMGALVLEFNGKRLELSGFTDEERQLGLEPFQRDYYESEDVARQWAEEHPGEEVPDWIEAPAFPRGSFVTFQYRDLTADGLPNEARYWRKHVVL